jgi:hypothetical protein
MKLLGWFHYLAKLFPKPPKENKETEKEIERDIVSKYGQGNASLQLGLYITEEEIKEQKADLMSYRF